MSAPGIAISSRLLPNGPGQLTGAATAWLSIASFTGLLGTASFAEGERLVMKQEAPAPERTWSDTQCSLPGDGQSVNGFSDHQSGTLSQSRRMQCAWDTSPVLNDLSLCKAYGARLPPLSVSNELLRPDSPGLKANSILSFWHSARARRKCLAKASVRNRSAVEVTPLRG